MRKPAAVALLLLFIAAAHALVSAQSRPRVVGRSTPASTAPTPFPQSSPAQKRTQDAQKQSRRGETAEEVGDDEVVRVNSSLVTVPVTVLDRDGRFIPGLRKEDFRIFEDGAEQEVAYFATVEQPFTVALVIDTSGSTRFKLEDIQDAAITFLDQLRPDDRVIVVSFDDQVRVLTEATNDRGLLRAAIRRTRTGEGTKLYDAVDLVIRQQFSRIRGRKAIVLFTDGVDTTSKQASYQSTLAEAEELDAMIYPIQYDTYFDQQGGAGGGWPGGGGRQRKPGIGDIIGIIIGGKNYPSGGGGGGGGGGASRGDYERANQYLRGLALATGGRHFPANELGYVQDAFTSIAEELRRQYSLGYYPARQSQASERRQIRVRVKRPNLVVRARDSYIYRPAGASAPADSAAQGTTTQSPPVFRKHLTK